MTWFLHPALVSGDANAAPYGPGVETLPDFTFHLLQPTWPMLRGDGSCSPATSRGPEVPIPSQCKELTQHVPFLFPYRLLKEQEEKENKIVSLIAEQSEEK